MLSFKFNQPIISIKKRLLPAEVRYALALFIVTRLVLTVIGIISRTLLSRLPAKWLAIWGIWDTGWYMRIADNWYPCRVNLSIQNNYGFFPLYPALTKFIGLFVRGNYLAGIVISNLAFFFGAIVLYRLARLDFDERTALRAVKYLFLYPAGFLFSAVLSESVFLCLALLSFYQARKKNWLLAGGFGFFLSLTRPFGVLIILPLFFEYMQDSNFQFSKVKADLFFLGLTPLGLLSFLAYCYLRCGHFFAYYQTKMHGWSMDYGNPFKHFILAFKSGDINLVFSVCFTLVVFLLLCYKKLRASYQVFGMVMLLAPLFVERTSPYVFSVFNGMIRFLAPIFPLYIILAKINDSEWRDQLLSIALALLQSFLMVFWTNNFFLVV